MPPSNILNKITVNAFYFRLYDDNPKVYFGYLRTLVNTIMKDGSRYRQNLPHNHYPKIFFPFLITGKEYILADHLAMQVNDVTPLDDISCRKKWQVSYLRPSPRYRDRERLDVIIRKLAEKMPQILAQAKKLPGDGSRSQRQFLLQFPPPFKEGLEEKVLYGTLTRKTIEFSLLEQDLPSYQRENNLPLPRLPQRLINQPPRGRYY